MQEIVHGTDGVQNTKLPFDDTPDNGRAKYTDAIGRAGASLNTLHEFRFQMPGQMLWLTGPGLVSQFLKTAAIVPCHPLLNGSAFGTGNLHDLWTGHAPGGEIDPMDSPCKFGVHFGSIEVL